MTAGTVARGLAERFEEAGLPYAFGGALALGAWGAPRHTNDVDVSVFVAVADAIRVVEALERAGAVVPPDAMDSMRRLGLCRARRGRTPIDVFVSDHPHAADMARRRRQVTGPDGTPLWFLSPEDVAITKLVYGRAKDVVDLERLFAVNDALDIDYIESWLTRIVPAGDRRLAVLADLRRRFSPSGG
jgi:hypothetical protein